MSRFVCVSLFFGIVYVSGQEIARQKCLEYSKAVYQQVDQISSLRDRNNVKISTCSIYDNPLIIGGAGVRPKEFPHMAVIGFGPSPESSMDWFCGGSLISEKHVLTAAHCSDSQSGPPQKVRLGAVSLTAEEDYIQEMLIDSFLIHPEYKRPVKYNDIAIITLKGIVQLTAFVRPACLNIVKNLTHTQAKATGFGKRNFGNLEGNKVLLKVDLDIIPNSECSKYMKFRKNEMPNALIQEMMCAGSIEGGRDTCQGDSGGPLQVMLKEPYCMYSVIGITSFGRFCGMANSPGIYTRVIEYVPWIEKTVWP